ncbi:sugar phosphate isomerase/epimerase family protein [Paenibacillus glycanilyticus]|uniref:sugar phosphate isomerase/epimerase family protein n=1 Tax=Paenibacillus glycanilyticus TaxID=126569 RepID=UPI000FDB7A09|nr:sugar phosphate isomerase/epimerase [Paenibacillus glycanilyticus]
MTRPGIGLQMYTLREETAQDFEGTLRKVAAMGYEGVEFAGYGDIPAEQMKALLDELNLVAIGNHVPLVNLETKIDEEIAYLTTIGAKYAICPWLPAEVRDADAWKKHLVNFAEYGKRFQEAGIVFCYHNHEFEFEVEIDGQVVFDKLYETVGADLLQVEMDLGWVQYAGRDVLEYISKYAGRLPLVHLKDFVKNTEKAEIDTVELGRGDLDLLPLIKQSEQADVKWLIVEQDRCANPPLQSVEESINWLKTNYLNQ